MLAGSPRPVLGAARRAGRWLASSKGLSEVLIRQADQDRSLPP